MASWPDSLPQAFLEGTMTKTTERVIDEFRADKGRPLRARKYTGQTYLITGVMLMTAAQLATLDAFYETDLAAGAERFNMNNIITGNSPGVVLFTNEWNAVPVVQNEYWRVSLAFTVWFVS